MPEAAMFPELHHAAQVPKLYWKTMIRSTLKLYMVRLHHITPTWLHNSAQQEESVLLTSCQT